MHFCLLVDLSIIIAFGIFLLWGLTLMSNRESPHLFATPRYDMIFISKLVVIAGFSTGREEQYETKMLRFFWV